MSVYLYSGTVGSGKSLLATYHIWDCLFSRKNVIANFPINTDYAKRRKIGQFFYKPSQEITPAFLVRFSLQNHVHTGSKRKKMQTLLVIDEAELLFNSREWGKQDRLSWIFFFSHSRKLNYDVILIAQNDKMLDRQVRAQCEKEYRCRSLGMFGTLGKVANFLLGGLFCAVVYEYTAHVKLLMPKFYRLHRRMAATYDTMMLFEDAEEQVKQLEALTKKGAGKSAAV